MWQLVDVVDQCPLTSSLPLSLGRSEFSHDGFHVAEAVKSVWTGPQEVLLFFVDSLTPHVVANVLTMPTTPSGHVVVVTGTLVDMREEERNVFEICPFSGRVCKVATAEDYADVRVLDYLRPTRLQQRCM